MRKKYQYNTLLFILIALSGIPLTLSFLVRNIHTENIVKFGNISMELIETEMLPDGTEQLVDLTECVDVTYHSTLDRRLKVKNVGSHEAYIRLKLNFGLEEGTAEENAEVQNYLSFQHDEVSWTESDGWYYYNKVLYLGETTENLMTTLEFDNNALTTNCAGEKLELDVKAQAVQVENNGGSALEAEGWPEE